MHSSSINLVPDKGFSPDLTSQRVPFLEVIPGDVILI